MTVCGSDPGTSRPKAIGGEPAALTCSGRTPSSEQVRKSNRSEAWLREVLAAYPHYEALRARRISKLQLGHGQSGHTALFD